MCRYKVDLNVQCASQAGPRLEPSCLKYLNRLSSFPAFKALPLPEKLSDTPPRRYVKARYSLILQMWSKISFTLAYTGYFLLSFRKSSMLLLALGNMVAMLCVKRYSELSELADLRDQRRVV